MLSLLGWVLHSTHFMSYYLPSVILAYYPVIGASPQCSLINRLIIIFQFLQAPLPDRGIQSQEEGASERVPEGVEVNGSAETGRKDGNFINTSTCPQSHEENKRYDSFLLILSQTACLSAL